MSKPFESYKIINENETSILRVRPQDRIEDGLSEFIVQMRGWPFESIFGPVEMPGEYKQVWYDEANPYYASIVGVLTNLGLEAEQAKPQTIAVRRYKDAGCIVIIVPHSYSYTIPKGPEVRTTSTDDEDARTIPYTFASYKDYCDYSGLYSVLIDALNQAAYGKGMERHANNLPFEEQKMQTICDAQGSSKGMAYQAIKKILESEGMGYQAKKREILGAIVYAAGIIIWEEKQPIEE